MSKFLQKYLNYLDLKNIFQINEIKKIVDILIENH